MLCMLSLVWSTIGCDHAGTLTHPHPNSAPQAAPNSASADADGARKADTYNADAVQLKKAEITARPAQAQLSVQTGIQSGIQSGAQSATQSGIETDDQTNPVVLFDSYHAHNFLDRGLVPGENTYHGITGLRRAAKLLTQRGVDVGELIVGPVTLPRLQGVKLVVLNLPSMDRPPWLVSEIEAIEKYIRAGGGMIFITDHSNCYYHQYHLLPLWERLGLVPTFETVCETEPSCLLSPGGSGWLLVRQFEPHPVTDGIDYFAIQTGGRVAGDGVVAWTSPQAWADVGAAPRYGEGNVGLFGDMRRTENEELGKQGIVLARTIDRGRVVVISDQNAIGDGQISYADNWRLWINACAWAGQLAITNTPVPASAQKTDSDSQRRDAATLPSLDQLPAFDQLLAGEPDRNAPPTLAEGSWQIECWEPLAKGPFHWGGNAPEQYYNFWCWLNRWCWASAHQRPSNTYPAGRKLLIAFDSDLSDPTLRARIEEVLASEGKVILLRHTPHRTDGADQANPAQPPDDEWLQTCLKHFGSSEQWRARAGAAHWLPTPICHWQITDQPGTLIAVPDPTQLGNSSFERPEVSPGPVAFKWQAILHRWLFELP
ncbi:MAG: hypothetical protein IT423_00205 [Pirellulaceae bacterium]|nr:hypothetical protein [Pirellulaceae bacterium]